MYSLYFKIQMWLINPSLDVIVLWELETLQGRKRTGGKTEEQKSTLFSRDLRSSAFKKLRLSSTFKILSFSLPQRFCLGGRYLKRSLQMAYIKPTKQKAIKAFLRYFTDIIRKRWYRKKASGFSIIPMHLLCSEGLLW